MSSTAAGGFFSPFFLCMLILCKDNKANRLKMYKGSVFFVVTFVFWSIVTVVIDNVVNLRIPEGTMGAYPDSDIDALNEKYGKGTAEARLEIDKLQAESLA